MEKKEILKNTKIYSSVYYIIYMDKPCIMLQFYYISDEVIILLTYVKELLLIVKTHNHLNKTGSLYLKLPYNNQSLIRKTAPYGKTYFYSPLFFIINLCSGQGQPFTWW